MCGIAGYISTDKYNPDKILSSIKHRGPDHSEYFYEFITNKNVFLGHNRLKIIDLSPAGNQPMYSDDKKSILIFNGEIYNYKILKEQYLKGTGFRSSTDTEVILKLYEKFGIKMLEYLNGDFALALLDKNKNKIFLVRDRLGVKPLYYFIKDHHFVFASEIKALFECGIIPSLNDESLEKYFVFKYVPGNDTLFNDIFRLKPASYLEYNIPDGSYSINAYWQLTEKKEFSEMSYSEAKNYLFNLLGEAISSQTMADVPVGTFFSGGIDSSIIAITLRDHPEITHYTARKSLTDLKKEGSTSDFQYAEMLASDFSLILNPINIGTFDLNPELINKINFYSDDLIADGSQIPSYLIANEAAKTSTVLLSGMGADEVFYGYAGHQISLLSMYLDSFPGLLTGPVTKLLGSISPGKGIMKAYKRYLKKFGSYYSFGNLKYGLFNIVGDYNNSLSVYNSKTISAQRFFMQYFGPDKIQSGSKEEIFKSITKFEFDNFLNKNLHYLDRMCMANSVEGRVPFLDYRIVEFAYSLPLHYKLSRTGKTKLILKDTYSKMLPGYITKRRKAGFGMPLRSIFSSENKIMELFDEDFFQSHKGFSVENIGKIIKNHISGIEDNSSIIYTLICYQHWYKMFLKQF